MTTSTSGQSFTTSRQCIPLFGPDITLPTIPGMSSNCEKELLQLLKEIDIVFLSEQSKLMNELREAEALCYIQKEEIKKLRAALSPKNQNSQNESIAIARKFDIEFEEYQKQLKTLQSENEDLKKQIASYLDALPPGTPELNIPKVIFTLQEEVQYLKEELKKRKLESLFMQDQYEKLNALTSSLQNVLMKEKEKTEILTQYPQLRDHTENIILTAFKRAMNRDNVNVKQVESELKNDITICFDELLEKSGSASDSVFI